MEVDRAHVSGYVVPLFRPAAVADVLDVIVTDERIVEVLQHFGIDRPECSTWPVLRAIGERSTQL